MSAPGEYSSISSVLYFMDRYTHIASEVLLLFQDGLVSIQLQTEFIRVFLDTGWIRLQSEVPKTIKV